MGKGSNTTTTQSGPPAQFVQGYEQALGQAQSVAATPYTQYPGNLLASLSPDQLAGIGSVESAAGDYEPYLSAAQNYFGQATQPLLSSIPTMSNTTLANTANQGLGLISTATNGGIGSAGTAAANAVTGATNTGVSGINAATAEMNPANLSQWESPYTQQVVQSTEQQLANTNAQQAQQLTGNAISSGAFGGDRAAVAQAVLAGQQQAQEAPTIAGLEQSGYTTALGALESQAGLGLQGATAAGQLGESGAATAGQLGLGAQEAQASTQLSGAGELLGTYGQQQQTELGANEANAWLNSQAGFGEAELGQEQQSLDLNQANALLGVGGLEQEQAQEELNIPYEEYMAAQAYPFQTTGWLANIAEGLGGASGGSSSTTYPGVSSASQIAGLGTAATGILGETGAFGSSGWLTGSSDAASYDAALSEDALTGAEVGGTAGVAAAGGFRGGSARHIAKRAIGGDITTPPSGLGLAPNVSVSVIPGSNGLGTAPKAPGSNLLSSSTGSTSNTSNPGQAAQSAVSDISTIASIAAMFMADGGHVNSTAKRAAGGPSPSAATMNYLGSSGQNSGGLGAVNTYLTNTANSAYVAPPKPAVAPQNNTASINQLLDPQQVTSWGQYQNIIANPTVQQELSAQSGNQNAMVDYNGTVYSLANPDFNPVQNAPANTGAGGGHKRGGQLSGFDDGGATTWDATSNPYAVAEGMQMEQALTQEASQGNQGQAKGGRLRGYDDGGDIGDDADADESGDLAGFAAPPGSGGTVAPGPVTGMGAPPTGGGMAPPPNFHGARIDPWQAMMSAGFGMMAGTSPYAGVNIGRGALEGMKNVEEQKQSGFQQEKAQASYQEAQARAQEAQARIKDTQNAQAERHWKDTQDISIDVARLQNAVEHNRAMEGIAGAGVNIRAMEAADTAKFHNSEIGIDQSRLQAEMAQGTYKPAVGPNGEPGYEFMPSHAGEEPHFVAGVSAPPKQATAPNLGEVATRIYTTFANSGNPISPQEAMNRARALTSSGAGGGGAPMGGAGAPSAAAGPRPVPTPQAIQMLMKNPHLAGAFISKFGADEYNKAVTSNLVPTGP